MKTFCNSIGDSLSTRPVQYIICFFLDQNLQGFLNLEWSNGNSTTLRYTIKTLALILALIFKSQFHPFFSFIAWCFVDDQSCFFFPKSKKHTKQYISGKSKIQLGCGVTISRAKRFLDNVKFRPGSSTIRILDDSMKFLFFSQHFEAQSNTLCLSNF